MSRTKRYVLGFLFTDDYRRVVLTLKTHGPAGMAGKLNGIGGGVQENELPVDAMVREAREETGYAVEAWRFFCTIRGEGWTCACFASNALSRDDLDRLPARNDVGEKLFHYRPEAARDRSDMMENLNWLIPMAIDTTGFIADVEYRAALSPSEPTA